MTLEGMIDMIAMNHAHPHNIINNMDLFIGIIIGILIIGSHSNHMGVTTAPLVVLALLLTTPTSPHTKCLPMDTFLHDTTQKCTPQLHPLT
jgi:pantothenate kinase